MFLLSSKLLNTKLCSFCLPFLPTTCPSRPHSAGVTSVLQAGFPPLLLRLTLHFIFSSPYNTNFHHAGFLLPFIPKSKISYSPFWNSTGQPDLPRQPKRPQLTNTPTMLPMAVRGLAAPEIVQPHLCLRSVYSLSEVQLKTLSSLTWGYNWSHSTPSNAPLLLAAPSVITCLYTLESDGHHANTYNIYIYNTELLAHHSLKCTVYLLFA